MGSESMQETSELLLAQQCQQGEPDALAELRERYDTVLTRILLARGASRTETEDLLADLWADCVAGDDERPSLLEKFSGRCSLQSWLATVLTNRLIDLRRRQKRRGDLSIPRDEDDRREVLEKIPAPSASLTENALTA